MLHLSRDPLASNSVLPALMGSVVLRQTHKDETTLTIEDPTGYAVLRISKCPPSRFPTMGDGKFIFLGRFSLKVSDIGHAIVVSADCDFDSISIIPVAPETENERSRKFTLSVTPDADYQFSNPLLSN